MVAMAAIITSGTCHEDKPSNKAAPWLAFSASAECTMCCNSGSASSGITANMGMTNMSCANSTTKDDCPPSDFIKPFSVKDWITIAVEDSANTKPIAKLVCHGKSNKMATIIIKTAQHKTWPPPKPNRRAFIDHNFFGCSSSPTRNSMSTTPNSAKCCNDTMSTWNQDNNGLIKIPASRYPSTEPRPKRAAMGTEITPATRKIKVSSKASVMGGILSGNV